MKVRYIERFRKIVRRKGVGVTRVKARMTTNEKGSRFNYMEKRYNISMGI